MTRSACEVTNQSLRIANFVKALIVGHRIEDESDGSYRMDKLAGWYKPRRQNLLEEVMLNRKCER